MKTVQSQPKFVSTLFIVVICVLSETSAGAERNADALPNGAVARLGWSPLRIGFADFTLTPDGRTIIVVTPQGRLRRLDAQTGRLLECRQLTDRSDVDLGKDATIHPAVLSANGETVALYEASYTGPRLAVYEVASGKMILRCASDEKRRILSGELSPNGKELAVIEEEGAPQDTVIPDKKISKRACLQLFDLKSGRKREIGTFPHGMLGLFFSADGKRLLVAHQDLVQTHHVFVSGQPVPHILTLFDLLSGEKLWRRTVAGMNFAVSRDGTTVLASGCPNGSCSFSQDFRDSSFIMNSQVTGFHVLQMDLEAKRLNERFVPCRLEPNLWRGIVDFILAPDDHTLVINHAALASTAYIVSWDLRSGKEIRRFKLPEPEGAQGLPQKVSITTDGRTLLTNRPHLQRWDLTTGKSSFAPPPENGLPNYPIQLAWTPDGKEVLACSDLWFLGRWNAATGKRLDLRRDNYGGTPFIRTPSGLRAIRFASQENQVAFRVFDPIAQNTLDVLRWAPSKSAAGFHIKGYSLTANGKTLTAVHDNRVTTWEVASGRQLFDVAMPDNVSLAAIHSFAPRFSPCGRWTLLGDKVHHVGDRTPLIDLTGKPDEWLIRGTGMRERPVWFSDDGRLMAVCYRKKDAKSAADDALAVWELASGRILARFERMGFVAQAAFAPDGRTIALHDAQGVHLMDLLAGKQRTKYPAPDVIHGSTGSGSDSQTLVFAPDGGTLATGHQDGTIMLWKVPRPYMAPPAALAEGEAEKLWTDLGSSSPPTARTAVDRLTRHPDAASALLAKRFRPPPADANKLTALLNDLDSDVFATREQASLKLRDYGARAETALRGRLTKFPSLEMRRRIEGILAEMAPPKLRLPLTGERLRGVRAIEVLERTGNAAARSLLQSWVEQTEDVQLAIEARLAMERRGE